jgi:PAS domain-containing protein
LLWAESGLRWEANPAARIWALTLDWSDQRWQALAEHLRQPLEAHGCDGTDCTASLPSLEPAVHWRGVPIGPKAWVVWLLPAVRPLPLAPPSAEVLTQLGIAYFRTDVANQRLYGNARAYELSGLPPADRPEQSLSQDAFRLQVHPDDVLLMLTANEEAMRPGAGVHDVQIRTRQPDGSYRHVLTSRIAEHDAAGRVVGVFGVGFDVTAQVESAARERAAALSLRVLTERAGIGTWSLDPGRDTLSWHGEMAAVLGDSTPSELPIVEAIERASRHIHPSDRELVKAGIAQVRDPAFESGSGRGASCATTARCAGWFRACAASRAAAPRRGSSSTSPSSAKRSTGCGSPKGVRRWPPRSPASASGSTTW